MAIGNKVEIEITANNKGAVSGIDQVTNKLGGLGKSASGLNFGGLTSGLNSMINPTMMLGTAVTGAATAFGVMIKNSMDVADQMSKDAQKIGLTTEKLSTLSYAASYADLSNEQLVASLKKLSMNMEDSIDGSSTLIDSLDKIGVSLSAANGTMKSSDALLMDVAQAFQTMPDGITKTNAAIDIFGKQGIEMIPLLNGGADGLRLMEEEARRLGLEISTKTGRDAEQFNDTIAKMEKMFEGAAMSLAGKLLPHLQDMADKIMPALGSTIDSGVGFMEDMIRAGEGLSKILDQVGGSNFWDKLLWLSTRPMNLLGASLGFFGDLVGGETEKANVKLTEFEEKRKKAINLQRKIDEAISKKKRDRLKEEGNASATALKDAQKLTAEWEKTQAIISKSLMKSSLSEISFKLYEINLQTAAWTAQFGKLDEEGRIARWAKREIAALNMFSDEFLKVRGEVDYSLIMKVPDPLNSNDVMSSPEMLALAQKKDYEIQMMTEVTTAELANLALRETMNSDMFSNMAGAAQNFYEASGSQSRAFFGVYKAMSIAQASIDTYKSAIAAYESMVGIPIVGPGLAIAAAAAATAFGLSNIARISAMQPGGGGGGSASLPSAPNVSSAMASVSNFNNSNNKQVNITVLGHIVDQDKFARELIPSLEKAYGDGNGGGS